MSIPDLLNCKFADFKKKYFDFAAANIILNISTNVFTCI